MKIPFAKPSIDEDEINEVIDTLKSDWLTMGPKTLLFEQHLADYLGVKHVVSVSSCTAALHMSLVALGIGSGDEVITSPYTFVATANVILQVGAKPVFVDIDAETYNIDPNKIDQAITLRTKAIIPVHYGGHPCDMKEITQIAQDHRLSVIEDAAHAIGAKYFGKSIGTIGDLTCFSFYATKNMTTGEGGAISTNDSVLAQKLKVLRLHGMNADAWARYGDRGNWYYEIGENGFKYNFTDIQAALGIHQLKKLDGFIDLRRKYAKTYDRLSDTGQIVIPHEKTYVKHAYHLYPILLKDIERNQFITKMSEAGIGCSDHFIPVHIHPLYRRLFGFKYGDFPVSESIYEREVSLPLYPKMTETEVDYVVDTVKQICNKDSQSKRTNQRY
jgi:UDP-4-amino-4,6-dideoxy-N-acetyl-beta-L-altrosamine transaminase